MMVIEFARDLLGSSTPTPAKSSEDTPDPVIHMMEHQKTVDRKGGTMRLGAYPCVISAGSLALALYRRNRITERHRHRYEVNNAYREALEEAGFKATGTSPDNQLVEIMELTGHPWFLGCQFHPEFRSRPLDCHPLFRGLIRAAVVRHAEAAPERSAKVRPLKAAS